MNPISVVSDIHLEFAKTREEEDDIVNRILQGIEPSMDLLLAGDIGNVHSLAQLTRFMQRVVTHVKKRVYYIPGNHEYYSTLEVPYKLRLEQVDQILRTLCENVGVTFLQKDVVETDTMILLGCTLWAMPDKSIYNQLACSQKVFVSRQEFLDVHYDHAHWLECQITKFKSMTDKRLVVMTHHMPSFKAIHTRFSKNPLLNTGFASDLDHLVERVDLWVSGHTHEFIDVEVSNVRLVCNPVGYPGEIRTTKFQENLIL